VSSASAAGLPGFFDQALREVNFFGGRLLSGRDMADEQQATASRERALAQALGTGVASGLTVSHARDASGLRLAAVDVKPGTGIAPDGSLLRLGQPLRIALARSSASAAATAPGTGDFQLCGMGPSGGPSGVTGVQVLTIAPADALSGDRAVGVAVDDPGLAQVCAARWRLRGVVFRLASVPSSALLADALALLDALAAGNDGVADALRNRLAWDCLGAPALAAARADPLGLAGQTGYPLGLVARANLLAANELPLALVVWGAKGLAFVDMWAVRRALHRPDFGEALWLTSGRRLAEAQAGMAGQAQHLAELQAEPAVDTASLRALDIFRYLPAAGLLPLASATGKGFDGDGFFSGLGVSEVQVAEGAPLEPLLRHAASHPPMDLLAEPPALIWRLRLRDNLLASSARPCLLWVAGSVPLDLAPRDNRARFDTARFAPGV